VSDSRGNLGRGSATPGGTLLEFSEEVIEVGILVAAELRGDDRLPTR